MASEQAAPGRWAVTLVAIAAFLALALGVVVVWGGLVPRSAPQALYAALAFVASIYYGWFARSIFTSKEAEDRRDWPDPFPYKVHQFWLNFAGSIVGWGVAWDLRHFTGEGLADFGARHALLAFVAFLGVTGHLPYTVVGAAAAIAGLVEKLLGFVKAK